MIASSACCALADVGPRWLEDRRHALVDHIRRNPDDFGQFTVYAAAPHEWRAGEVDDGATGVWMDPTPDLSLFPDHPSGLLKRLPLGGRSEGFAGIDLPTWEHPRWVPAAASTDEDFVVSDDDGQNYEAGHDRLPDVIRRAIVETGTITEVP